MKKIVGVIGALVSLASAAPAALADPPCDPPASTYVVPSNQGYVESEYVPYEVAPAPVVAQPAYRYEYGARWREARRAELARRRWEAYRRWRWRHEHRGGYYPTYSY